MDYIKIVFPITSEDQAEELTAYLAGLDFEAFEETPNQLMGYIAAANFDALSLEDLSKQLQLPYQQELLPDQNWNATWESNFEPVIIDGFCSVRADFHPEPKEVLYDLVITPKMSFGTGHHATTALMIGLMRGLDWSQKRVMDYGTGTGILAILAAKMGAEVVLAIDNDEWAVVNSIENAARNAVENIQVKQASLEQVPEGETYDIILANINRNILIASMEQLFQLLHPGSQLLLSGILDEDVPVIKQSAATEGFMFQHQQSANGWVAIQFARP